MELKREIGTIITQAVLDAGYDLAESFVEVRVTDPEKFGDFSTNIALIVAARMSQNPLDVAQKIVDRVDVSFTDVLANVTVSAPGFINIEVLVPTLVNRIKDLPETFGKTDTFAYQKVMVEFTDPNPYKEFHVGHLMPNIIGSAIANLFEWGGAQVLRVNYQGDVGLHVAKSVWGLLEYLKREKVSMSELATKDITERIAILGSCYAQGHKAYASDDTQKNEIIAINKTIYAQKTGDVWDVYHAGRLWSLAYFETMYERLNTHFDEYFFESEVSADGLAIVTAHIADGIFVESEGAVIYPAEQFGLHNRVFINSEGLPTYEAKELALSDLKYRRWPYDRSIIVTAHEINEYFKVLLHAMARVYPDYAKKTTHIGHGMLDFKGRKMSSRTGDIVRATEIIDTIREEVGLVIAQSQKSTDSKISKKDQERIAVSALRYAILRQSLGKNIVFDLNSALSFEGDSGPYLQYTYARANHVIENARGLDHASNKRELTSCEIALVKSVVLFPDVVREAQQSLSPHLVTQYATSLSQQFNAFYHECRVIEHNTVDSARLDLTRAVFVTLGNALDILGISRLTSM
ncbi:arginine--tRNA ligase [candidate division WWE3 bacterium CG_4_9_14_3_um_filter_41_6]|uniref:Arginine--tRNA ligase n=1 Tax=candidate division WWE3 bacterium CG_4_10_14_0_2_um_filter_41_14 TaxID=1975072 RepID=A0A2M7TM92_UNCKA|nr:MAG: arginine--tRNA ligase [candidate division WWE3 bacterium CG_4_10_14_0_2_um_filter_41_14]PJA39714.1 MAG: arginine--tRNA ligase [candidate division WWE3 bacterium CG_4_9_14_3_um_filter_41_6]